MRVIRRNGSSSARQCHATLSAPPPGSTGPSGTYRSRLSAPNRRVSGGTPSDAFERVRPPIAKLEEPVVTHLDDLAHLPEGFDRQVATTFGVIPLEPIGNGGQQRGVMGGHDRGAEHVAGRVGLTDLEQVVTTEPACARDDVSLAAPEVD